MAAAATGFILLHAFGDPLTIVRVAIAAIDCYSDVDPRSNTGQGATVILRSGKSVSVTESADDIDRMLI